MKKKLLLVFSFVLLCCLIFAIGFGCSKGELEKISISNKAELTTEWTIGDADRTIKLELQPESADIDDSEITVSSSNDKVIKVSDKTLKAVGAGTAKITVAAGELSDSVDITVKAALEGVSITNKVALTAEWTVGDADRTVEIKLSPDSVDEKDVDITVSSSDDKVIKAVGKTLKAVGAGTATINVKAGKVSDSVEITVAPAWEGIHITNKSELTAVWTLGDAARTLQYKITPESLSDEEVTVTSSDSKVITVKGTTLNAMAVGKATITVTVGAFSDSVEVGVRPALASVSITNKEALKKAWVLGDAARDIEIELNPSDYYTPENTEITAESDNTQAVKVEGFKLIAVGKGKAKITVTAGKFTDTVEVEVTIGAPKLTVNESDINCLEGDEVTLPEATAIGCDGTELTKHIKVSLDGDTVEDSCFLAEVKGTYTLTYTVEDPRDTSKTASAEITVNVYRKVLSWNDNTFSVENELAEDANQVVKTSNTGWAIAQFNIQPSKLYYAEITYEIPEPNGGMTIGMGHFTEGNTTRWLAMGVDRGDANHKVRDFDTQSEGGWTFEENKGYSLPFSWRIGEYRGIPDTNKGHTKYAVARVGDFFYAFVNDTYVCSVTFEYYRNQDTLPGIFCGSVNTASLTNITYIGGKDAQTKIDELLQGGAKQISAYVPDSWASGSKSEGNFTVNPVTEEKGVNFTFNSKDKEFNDGMVSPYVYLDGNFTFEWEYKNTDAKDYNGESRMILEARPWNYGSEIVQFGADYITSNRRFLLNVPQNPEGSKWDEPGSGFDNSKGAKFTISRVLKENCAEYTMTATSINTPSQTYTRTFEWAGEKWNEPVIMLWHNTRVSGEFSNITYRIDK